MKTISQKAVEVLGSMEVEGNLARITAGQLDRKLYDEVNKALEALGGKWNRKLGAHVFDHDAAEELDQVVLTGRFTDAKQEFGFFETPGKVALEVAERAQLKPGHRVLEPSCGRGRLIEAALAVEPKLKISAIDVQAKNIGHVRETFANGVVAFWIGDFLQLKPDPIEFDRVLMNPPFAKQADIDHVRHAHRFLVPGGKLVAIMSAGIEFRENKKAIEFRRWLADMNAVTEPLPDDAFKDSGTGVRTVVVTIG